MGTLSGLCEKGGAGKATRIILPRFSGRSALGKKHKGKLRIWKLNSLQLSTSVFTPKVCLFQGSSHLGGYLRYVMLLPPLWLLPATWIKSYGQYLEGCIPLPAWAFMGDWAGEKICEVWRLFLLQTLVLWNWWEYKQISLSSCSTEWHLNACSDSFLELVSQRITGGYSPKSMKLKCSLSAGEYN